jgi:hypothetical protein
MVTPAAEKMIPTLSAILKGSDLFRVAISILFSNRAAAIFWPARFA